MNAFQHSPIRMIHSNCTQNDAVVVVDVFFIAQPTY